MNNKYKNFSLLTVTVFVTVTLFIILFNFIVDPFQIYRAAKLYTFKVQDQRYLNAGLAKSYPYDTLLLGTSMTENFHLHNIKKNPNFAHPIKLSLEGASIYELRDLIQLAIHTHKNLKNIILDIEVFSFKRGSQEQYKASTFPTYLYDTNSFNDISYLLNFKVFKKSLKVLKEPYNKNRIEKQLDSLYNWQQACAHSFTLRNVLNSYNFSSEEDKKNKLKLFKQDYQFKILKENFDKALYPLLTHNPKITFYLFYPPYSVLSLKIAKQAKALPDILEFKRYVVKKCANLPNVKIYDFQVDFATTNKLSNYKDLGHYHERINALMLEYIQQNKFRVTQKNIDEYIKELKRNTENFKVPVLK
jgi:hypothetical protein